MTNETIEQFIDSLNTDGMNDRTFRRTLTDYVEYAKVWLSEPKGECGNEGSYDFFLIKNEENVFVGAVLDMGKDDLHCFVKQEHRGRGHLESAMISTIWPKLYQLGRTKQRVSIQDPQIMNWAIKRLEFIKVGDGEAEKDLTSFAELPQIKGKDLKFDRHEFSAIAIHLRKAKHYLTMAAEKIAVSHSQLDAEFETRLVELVEEIDQIKDDLDFSTEK